MELISREGALKAIDAKCKRYFESIGITDYDYDKADEQSRWISDGAAMAAEAVLALPTAEKVGKWVEQPTDGRFGKQVECSECGEVYWAWMANFGYCPNCGARMEGEENV